jgi:hypothetical protein
MRKESCICVSVVVLAGCTPVRPPVGASRSESVFVGEGGQSGGLIGRNDLYARGVVAPPGAVKLQVVEAESGKSDRLRFTLKNESQDPVWLVLPRYVQYGNGNIRNDVWLDVRDSSNSTMANRAVCRAPIRLPRAQDYALVQPHESVSEVTVWCAGFSGSGPWFITAHYRDIGESIPVPPNGAKWFGSSAVSNTLEVHPLLENGVVVPR